MREVVVLFLGSFERVLRKDRADGTKAVSSP